MNSSRWLMSARFSFMLMLCLVTLLSGCGGDPVRFDVASQTPAQSKQKKEKKVTEGLFFNHSHYLFTDDLLLPARDTLYISSRFPA